MLQIRDLTCGYDSRFLLQDINFKVAAGEFIGIVGPNGSGKTTLLRAISGVLKLKKGVILFEGKDIPRINQKELARKMAVVSQNPPVNSLTTEEFVLLGRIPHFQRLQFLESKQDLEIAERAMALTGTLKLRGRPVEEISGGEKQLVLIARALCQEPRLLLLDEPTAHLDITHQVAVLDLIKKLNKEFGLTVITVLHDLNLAGEYCDKLILLNNGRIHKVGAPGDVLTYQVIEDVYKTVVLVKENPISRRPYIFLVPQEGRK
ncbi:MAG: ABC transporter ATP-binding protein [Candidatus Omnitrophota bacterium]